MRIVMILILSFWSFTAWNQSDSLKCFTLEQVKIFLITKVELNNCLEQYDAKAIEVDSLKEEKKELQEEKKELEADVEKFKRKSKKRGGIAIATSGGLILTIALALGIK